MSKRSKHPLSTRTKNVCGVVSFKDYELYEVESFADELEKFFRVSASMYAEIVHSLDVNDLGELEIPHIHYVAIELSKVLSLVTLFNIAT